MERINTSTKATDLHGSGKHGFTEGDIPTGVRPTGLSAAFFNALQEELCRLLEGYGKTPTAATYTQLRDLFRERERSAQLGLLLERDPDTAEAIYGFACDTTQEPPVWVALTQTTDVPRSTDGYVWGVGTGAEPNMRSAVFAEGLFVAVGAGGKIQTSPTGASASWTSRTSGTTENLWSIAHGAGRFVACGQGALLSSPDGITWAAETAPGVTGNFKGVGFGDGLFVAVTDAGEIYTSPDGDTWTARSSGTSDEISSVAHDGVHGWLGVGDGVKVTSPDGITWTDAADALFIPGSSIASDGLGSFVVAGAAVNNGFVFSMDGGQTFTVKGAPLTPFAVAFGAGRWVFGSVSAELAITSEL